jgi:hypothetical protein
VNSRLALASVLHSAGRREAAIALLESSLALPDLALPGRLALASRLHAMYVASAASDKAERLRADVLEPFLQQDPASLDGVMAALREEVLREMQPGTD